MDDQVTDADQGPESGQPDPARSAADAEASARDPAGSDGGDAGPDTAPAAASRLPYPLQSWWGALLLGVGGILAYLTASQLVPGAVIAIAAIYAAEGQAPSAEALERAFLPYLPHVVAWGAVVSLIGIVALRGTGMLAPAPEEEVRARGPWRAAGWVLFAGLAVVFGQQAIVYLQQTWGVPPHEQELILTAAENAGLGLALALAIAAPIGEELAFRRFLFGTLRVGLGRPLAYLLSIGAFALIHFNPSALPLYAWMGFWFTFAYERSGSVWGAIAVHALNNGFVAWALLSGS